jgi:hypothetical protein
VLRCHEEIAGKRDLEAATERKPVDRRDHGLVEIEPLDETGVAVL